jgi:hypothetical protein
MAQVVLVGAGYSIKEGIDQGLWRALRKQNVWSINYAYQAMPFIPSAEVWQDLSFWVENQNSLHDLYKQGCCLYARGHDDYRDSKEITCFEPTPRPDEFYGREALTKGKIFTGRMGLTGVFALSLAVAKKYETVYLCFDNQTEVFTQEGWKFFKDLRGTELILTRKFNGDTEWSTINKKMTYWYEGNMKHIKSKGIDLMVTPEHKFGLLKKGQSDYVWKTIPEFKTTSGYFIPRIFRWSGEPEDWFYLPTIEVFGPGKRSQHFNEIKIPMLNWVKFLGLYLAEGCVTFSKGGNYKVTIYQNHTLEQDIFIESILKNLPFHYKKHVRGWIIYGLRLTTYLKRFGLSDQKYIPQEIKNLPQLHLNLLLESLIFGDGCYQKNGNIAYYTTSKRLADDVQELFFKCGGQAGISFRKSRKSPGSDKPTKNSWVVTAGKSEKQGGTTKISVGNLIFNKNIKDVWYRGFVYDLNVKNHTLFVRRNNQCCWSGNCGYDFGSLSLRDTNTHFYQDRGINSGAAGHPSIYMYDDRPRDEVNDFDHYLDVMRKDGLEIYNVSLNSNISSFPKIGYEEFFRRLSHG